MLLPVYGVSADWPTILATVVSELPLANALVVDARLLCVNQRMDGRTDGRKDGVEEHVVALCTVS